jgi:hypothetical protein
MKTLLPLALSVISAPALAHSGLAEHAHPHDASAFGGEAMVGALLTLVAVGAAYYAAMSRAEAKSKASK